MERWLLLNLLVFSCPDPGSTYQAALEDKMSHIMERMTMLEADMEAKDETISVQAEKIAALEEKMKSLAGRVKETVLYCTVLYCTHCTHCTQVV